MHHQHTSVLHHPLAATCTANLSLQLPAPSQPLGPVWQGDSDTYRHVTRATRVSPRSDTCQDTRAAPGLGGRSAPAASPPGRQGWSPATTLGGTPVPCSCAPRGQVATGANGHGSKWPRTPLPTSPSRDTFLEPWGEERGMLRARVAPLGTNEQDGQQPWVETPVMSPRNRSRSPGLRCSRTNTVGFGEVWRVPW